MEGWKRDQDFQDFQDLTRIRGEDERMEEGPGFSRFSGFDQDKMEGWRSGRIVAFYV